ncbi:MAG: InlB B-repeat-containing protein [Tannerella sp.]|jgi:uncharacterized repeat protein (TIGR02543 family)|nr:InlB B-repeat-containing protein [Tannerella sp.]
MKRLRLLFLISAFSALVMTGLGQTTYSVSNSGICASAGTITAGGTTFLRGAIKLSATVSGSTATFTVGSCVSGGSISGHTLHLRESTSNNLSTVLGQSSDVKTSTSTSFTYNLSFTSGTRYYTVFYSNGSLFGCTELVTITASQPIAAPSATTGSAVAGTTTADLFGTINPHGVNTVSWFEYGTTSYFGSSTGYNGASSSQNGDITIANSISGLTPNTTYYYRVVAQSNGGTTYGTSKTFKTSNPAVVPTVSLNDASNITTSSATISGYVNPKGAATMYAFEYARNSTFSGSTTVPASPVSVGSGTSNVFVSQNISGLYPNTTYYYRIYAANSAGVADNGFKQFTTSVGDVIKMASAINIPSTVYMGENYNFTVSIVNSSGSDWTGSFYLKEGSTDVTSWQNVYISGVQTVTLNSRTYTPSSLGTKTLTLYFQTNGTGSGTQVPSNGYTNPITVTVKEATHTLTVNNGSGSGNYTAGTVVNISANTAPGGQVFDKWTSTNGGSFANANSESTTFTMPANNTTVTANYKPVAPTTYTVIVKADPATGGSVSGGGTFDDGTSITVTATANPGYKFVNWTNASGNSQGSTNPLSFTLRGDITLTAHFEAVAPTKYRLTVQNGIGSGDYAAGDKIPIAASSPPAGQVFDRWTSTNGGSFANANSAGTTFTMPAGPTTVTANYKKATCTIKLSANPAAGGSVDISGSAGVSGTFNAGTQQTVTATPNSGYTFKNWTENGTQVSTNASYTFTLNSDRTLVANFEAIPTYKVTFDAAGGTPTPQPQNVVAGGKVTQPTHPVKPGWTFVGWFIGSQQWNFSTNTVDKPITLTAKWAEEFASIKLDPNVLEFDAAGIPKGINSFTVISNKAGWGITPASNSIKWSSSGNTVTITRVGESSSLIPTEYSGMKVGFSDVFENLIIKQSKKPVLEVLDKDNNLRDNLELHFNSGGTDRQNFKVRTNLGNPSMNYTWDNRFTNASGTNKGNYIYDVFISLPSANNSPNEKRSTLTITVWDENGKEMTKTVTLIQEGNSTSDFEVYANGGLRAYNGSSQTIKIPEKVNGVEVRSIDANVKWSTNPGKVKVINIPKTVSEIDYGAFKNLTDLDEFIVSDENIKYTTDHRSGTLFECSKPNTKNDELILHTFPANSYHTSKTGTFATNESLRVIGIAPYAFYNNRTLTELTISSDVKDIGLDAFGYTKLEKVVMKGAPPSVAVKLFMQDCNVHRRILYVNNNYLGRYGNYRDSKNYFCDVQSIGGNSISASSTASPVESFGNVGLSFNAAESGQLNGSFIIQTPDGVDVDMSNTRLSNEFSAQHQLQINQLTVNTWAVNVQPSTDPDIRSASDDVNTYQDILNIAYYFYGQSAQNEQMTIQNILFYNDNTVIQEDEIKVSLSSAVDNKPMPVIKQQKLTVYPNPAENTLTVKLPNPDGERATITLYSLSGHAVYRSATEESTHTVDVSSLPRGIYILQVKAGSETYTEKVIRK